MRPFIFSLSLALVVGCSPITPQESQLLQAQLSRPTFKVECPNNGCNFSKLEYYDPNQRVRMPTNGYDVANRALDTLGSVVSGAAPYWAISKGFKYMNSSESSSVQNTTTSTTTDSSSVTESSNSFADSFNTTTSTVTDTVTSETPLIFPPSAE